MVGRSRVPAARPGARNAPAPQRGGAERVSAKAPAARVCARALPSSSPRTGQCLVLPPPEGLARRCGLRPGPPEVAGRRST